MSVDDDVVDVRVSVTGVGEDDTEFAAVPFVRADRVADEILDGLVTTVTCADALMGAVDEQVDCTAASAAEGRAPRIVATVTYEVV